MNKTRILGKILLAVIIAFMINEVSKIGQNIFQNKPVFVHWENYKFPILTIPFGVIISFLLMKKRESK
jgi:hypothetical protein